MRGGTMHDANASSQTVTRATEAAERAGARARPAIMQSTWALSTLNEDQNRRIFFKKQIATKTPSLDGLEAKLPLKGCVLRTVKLEQCCGIRERVRLQVPYGLSLTGSRDAVHFRFRNGLSRCVGKVF